MTQPKTAADGVIDLLGLLAYASLVAFFRLSEDAAMADSLLDLVLDVLADSGHAGFVIARVREAIAADPSVAGRLALWARRLVGEALGQAQRVAAEREPLARLLAGNSQAQLGEIGRMFANLTDAHANRMAALGLAA